MEDDKYWGTDNKIDAVFDPLYFCDLCPVEYFSGEDILNVKRKDEFHWSEESQEKEGEKN